MGHRQRVDRTEARCPMGVAATVFLVNGKRAASTATNEWTRSAPEKYPSR